MSFIQLFKIAVQLGLAALGGFRGKTGCSVGVPGTGSELLSALVALRHGCRIRRTRVEGCEKSLVDVLRQNAEPLALLPAGGFRFRANLFDGSSSDIGHRRGEGMVRLGANSVSVAKSVAALEHCDRDVRAEVLNLIRKGLPNPLAVSALVKPAIIAGRVPGLTVGSGLTGGFDYADLTAAGSRDSIGWAGVEQAGQAASLRGTATRKERSERQNLIQKRGRSPRALYLSWMLSRRALRPAEGLNARSLERPALGMWTRGIDVRNRSSAKARRAQLVLALC